MSSFRTCSLWFPAITLLCAGATAAPPRDFATYRPEAQATKVEASQAPAIDGDISDPIWQKAQRIDEFYQLEPREGQAPEERTVVRVLYDQDNIYFSFECFDPAPVTARIKQRDGTIDNDDIVRIYLDPNKTRRNAYIFEINPLGARREGLLQNNTEVLYQWNALWNAKSRITATGWTAEVAIPFRSVSHNGRSEWGFDIFRLVRHNYERIRWASINKAIAAEDITQSGTLTGIDGIRDDGLGLDVQAFGLTRYRKNWDAPGRDTGFSFRPSGNLYYKITPSLTGTLTYNTDFSDAPLDERKVNISRFSLFYPERRDFFLQDASAFEFGGALLTANGEPNGSPFFSRRIGIVNNEPVNILGGAKLSGEYEGFGIGALSVRTAGGAGVGEQFLSAARLTTPVLSESKLGMMFTNGDPTGNSNNTVTGADFQYHDSDVFGTGKVLKGDFYYERSFSNRSGDDHSFGMELNFPNEPWSSYFRFKQVGKNFDPALGFVSRPEIRQYQGQWLHRQRFTNSVVRWMDNALWFDVVTGLDNKVQSRVLDTWHKLMTNQGDFFLFEYWNDYEKTPAFNLPHNIVVPAGRYIFNTWHTRFESAPVRLISIRADVQYGKYYGGKLLKTDSTVNLNPNETLSTGLRHVMQEMKMPGGNVTIHVESIDTSVNFTPDMYVRAQLQYDNISRDFAASLRYRWEFEPGSELLVVVGEDATMHDLYYRSRASQFSVRLGKTFRL